MGLGLALALTLTQTHLGSCMPGKDCLVAVNARLAMPKSEPSSRALKPRETSTLPTSSVAISWASAPPSECPVIRSDQSPGVPAVAETRSSLTRRDTALAAAKKPLCTWLGSGLGLGLG